MKLPPEIDAALAAWRDRLRRAGTAIATLDKLEAHARQRTLEHIEAGIAPRRAFEQAIAALGAPSGPGQESSHVGADRRISHFARMWIGLGIAAFMIVLWISSFWLPPRQFGLGVLTTMSCVISLPFVFAYPAYQAAAGRAQSAIGHSSRRSIDPLRIMLWLTGAAGLLWWGIAADWFLSLLVTYVLLALLVIQTSAIAGRALYTARRIWPDLTASLCILALLVSAAGTGWPLRLFFLASQGQLEALANRVEAGESVDGPVWAGAFRIARTEIRSPEWRGGTCLWVFSNPGHPTGLVRSHLRGGPGTNVNRKIRLSENWYYLSED